MRSLLRNALVASAVVVSVSLSGSPLAEAAEGRALLSYVPDDTIFYFGYSEPYEARDYYAALPEGLTTMSAGEVADSDPAEIREYAGDGPAVLLGLYQLSLESIAGNGNVFDRLGLDEGGVGGLYAVGALPVGRIALADTEVFTAALDAAEERAGLEVNRSNEGLRRYSIAGSDYQTVIATKGGYAVFTVDGPGVTSEALATALGQRQPKHPLAASDRLSRLAKRHRLLPWATGFVDHQAIVAGLTGVAGSRFGENLDAALAAAGIDESPFAALRTPACRDDLQSIAADWPRTVAGVKKLEPQTGYTATSVFIENADRSVTDQLARLRGHIPASIERGRVAGLGIGLDMTELVPVLQGLSQRYTQASFECPALVQSQQALMQQNIAALGMLTAMVGDVKGLGLAVESLKATPDARRPATGTGLLEIATPRPQTLWGIMQPMLGVGPAQLPQPGAAPIPLDVPMLSGLDLRAAQGEQRLMFLVGENTSAPDTTNDLVANGLLEIRYNYASFGKLMRQLAAADTNNGDSEQQRAVREAMRDVADIDMEYRASLDIVPGALKLDTELIPTEQSQPAE